MIVGIILVITGFILIWVCGVMIGMIPICEEFDGIKQLISYILILCIIMIISGIGIIVYDILQLFGIL